MIKCFTIRPLVYERVIKCFTIRPLVYERVHPFIGDVHVVGDQSDGDNEWPTGLILQHQHLVILTYASIT